MAVLYNYLVMTKTFLVLPIFWMQSYVYQIQNLVALKEQMFFDVSMQTHWNLLHLQQKTNVQIRNALCEVSYISTHVRLAFCSVICTNFHALITKICTWRYVCPDGKYTPIYKLRLQIHTRLVDTDVIYTYMVYEWMKRWLPKHLPHAPMLT